MLSSTGINKHGYLCATLQHHDQGIARMQCGNWIQVFCSAAVPPRSNLDDTLGCEFLDTSRF